MNAGELCNRQVVIARPELSIAGAAQLMREHHVGDLVIVEDSGNGNEPVAVVTDRDLVIEILAPGHDPGSKQVKDAMTAELVTALESESVSDVVSRMRSQGVRRIPVVNERGTLEGIITYDDLVEFLSAQLAALHDTVDHQQRREQERARADV